MPWRNTGTERSWGGKRELPRLQLELVETDEPSFERLVRSLLRLALAPPGRLPGQEDLQSLEGGILAHAGEMGMPVFVQPIAFQGRSEDLGEAHILRCRNAMERFAHSPLSAEVYLLVHNRDPRSPAFRSGLADAIAAFRETGRVAHVLVWDSRDLLEGAFDGLFDLTWTMARQGSLSVAPVETALARSSDLLTTVPLRVSWLSADQHRMGPDDALSLQSLLLLSRERTGVQPPRVAFAHRAFQEFFLAWFLAEGYLDRQWVLPASVREWIEDLRREKLLDPEARREAERPPGLPPAPARPIHWVPPDSAGDGWHFTGHGLFRRSSPDLSELWLEADETLTPPHLGGEARRMGVKRPLVFLNACETGQTGLSLADIGGWVPCFLRAGAGAFLGALWEIRDSKSRDFARVFYAGFTGGLPLAEAVHTARRAIRSEDAPTWLAYTVFGHPRAVCRPVPGRGGDAG